VGTLIIRECENIRNEGNSTHVGYGVSLKHQKSGFKNFERGGGCIF